MLIPVLNPCTHGEAEPRACGSIAGADFQKLLTILHVITMQQVSAGFYSRLLAYNLPQS